MSAILSRLICGLMAAVLLFSPSLAMADGNVLPGSVFTAILLKTLNYDRNIDRHMKEKVVIAIVYLADDTKAQNFADQVKSDIFKAQATFLLKDKRVEGKVLVWDRTFDKAKFEEQLKQENVSVLVVATQDAKVNEIIFETTRALGINTACYSSECVAQGAGLGIFLKNGKPRMLINPAAVQQEGSDYSGKFLALCDVVK